MTSNTKCCRLICSVLWNIIILCRTESFHISRVWGKKQQLFLFYFCWLFVCYVCFVCWRLTQWPKEDMRSTYPLSMSCPSSPYFNSYFRSDFCPWALLCFQIISEAAQIPAGSWSSPHKAPVILELVGSEPDANSPNTLSSASLLQQNQLKSQVIVKNRQRFVQWAHVGKKKSRGPVTSTPNSILGSPRFRTRGMHS